MLENNAWTLLLLSLQGVSILGIAGYCHLDFLPFATAGHFGLWLGFWIWSRRLPLRVAWCLLRYLAVLIIFTWMIFKETNSDLWMWRSFVFRVFSLLVSKMLFIGELCNNFLRFSVCKIIDPVFSVTKKNLYVDQLAESQQPLVFPEAMQNHWAGF